MQDVSSESAVAREPEIERVILLRGVVWQGKEVNAFKMWQDLMRFWPTPFAPEHTTPANQLYAHAGIKIDYAKSSITWTVSVLLG